MDSQSRPRRWALGRLPPLFSSSRSRTLAFGALLVLAVTLGVGVVAVHQYFPLLSDPTALRGTI